MPIPDYQTVMLPLLRLVDDSREHTQAATVAALADRFHLTPDERAQLLPSGTQPVFYNRVHWARTYLRNAGLLENTGRGKFRITPTGHQVLKTNPPHIDNRLLKHFPQFLAFHGGPQQPSPASPGGDDTGTPGEMLERRHGARARRPERQPAKMATRTYWLDLFTGTTWREFLNAGGTVSGFRESRWKTVQQIKPGDYLLCYLTGISRWVGALEVVAPPFRDNRPIWNVEEFPCRLSVKIVVALTPETGVPVFDLRDRLSAFHDLKNPAAWTGHFRGSPRRWPAPDGEVIVQALLEAQQNPVSRPVDPRKLARRPEGLGTKIGPVTVPDPEPVLPTPSAEAALEAGTAEATAHEEIQWLLLKLGSDLGLDVWVARNDRGRTYDGKRFADIPRLKAELPLQFDSATNRTIELIDVLWLRGNAIQAAFEVESTTSIYSGLLRMSDLIAMQPNLNIPLYIVAPDERRDKVIQEVNRPTFSRLSPRMADICRFISFSTLRERVMDIAPVVKYLKPEFVQELSETCEVEEA